MAKFWESFNERFTIQLAHFSLPCSWIAGKHKCFDASSSCQWRQFGKMINPVPNSQACILTRRLLLLASVALVAMVMLVGCGKQAVHVAIPISPLDEFSDAGVLWQRSDDELSSADNQRIGAFFQKRPELIGSPDWTGQPEKYVSKKPRPLTRFYWFSGNENNPSWNALEIDGSRFRELSGTGIPGADKQSNQ